MVLILHEKRLNPFLASWKGQYKTFCVIASLELLIVWEKAFLVYIYIFMLKYLDFIYLFFMHSPVTFLLIELSYYYYCFLLWFLIIFLVVPNVMWSYLVLSKLYDSLRNLQSQIFLIETFLLFFEVASATMFTIISALLFPSSHNFGDAYITVEPNYWLNRAVTRICSPYPTESR